MTARQEHAALFSKLAAAIRVLRQGSVAEFSIFRDQELCGENSWEMTQVREALMEYRVSRSLYSTWEARFVDHQQKRSQNLAPDVDPYDLFLPDAPLPSATV